ncbi:hypothetical protein STZ1_21069 [Bacillus subtilis]
MGSLYLRFKWVWLFVIMLLLAGCQPSYWVLEKDRIGEGSPDLEIYANYLQMHDDVQRISSLHYFRSEKDGYCVSRKQRER